MLNNVGGALTSDGTIAELPMYGKYLSVYYGSNSRLHTDSAWAPGANPGNIGISLSGGVVSMRRARLLDVHQGISCLDNGFIQSRFVYTDVGLNRIRANWIALLAAGMGKIDFGKISYGAPGGWGKANAIHLEDYDNGWHVYNMGSANALVYADSSYWSHGPTQNLGPNPKTYGTCSVLMTLSQDPVPFIGSGSGFSKVTASVPPSTWRDIVRTAVSSNNAQLARNILAGQLTIYGSGMALVDLSEIARWTQELNAGGLRDTLYTLLLARQDMESKLLAADMAMEDSLFEDASDILDTYSFSGSQTLLTQALARRAVVRPLTGYGGYGRGLAARDSLLSLVGIDPLYRDLIVLYPKLFSALCHGEIRRVPKQTVRRLLDRVLPDGIDVWPNYPNPFTDLTSFTFKLGEDMHVRIAVYDAIGREVAMVTDADYMRGVHSVVLHSIGLSSGLYF